MQESLPLFYEKDKSKVEEMLDGVDVMNMTPIEALNMLYKLKRENEK